MTVKETLDEMYLWVDNYIKTFYTDDVDIQKNILLKEKHTGIVAEISKKLAANLGLNAHDQLLAEMIGLFHDIGRFKQYRVYQTFNDRLSENHSLLGLKEIAQLKLLTRLQDEDLQVFKFAIENHNAISIAVTDNDRWLLFAKIIRDADKLDIYRVLQPSLTPSDGSGYSDNFMQSFLKGQQCDYTEIKTKDDQKLVRLLWMYNIYFGWTMQRIIEYGYVDHIVSCLPQNEVTEVGVKNLKLYMAKKAKENNLPVL